VAEDKTAWYESNLLWGPLALAGAIVLTVVAATKHDLRWLLWFAWPCFAICIWWVAKLTKEKWIVTVLGTAIAGAALLWLSSWLRPEPPQQVKAEDHTQPKNPSQQTSAPISSNSAPASPRSGTSRTKSTKARPHAVPPPEQRKGSDTKPSGSSALSVGTISQAPGSALSFNQQGGITAGTINVDTRPRISINDAQAAAITDAMKPFAGHSAYVVENGNQQDVIDAGKRINEALLAAGIKSEVMSGMAFSAGGNKNTALFVGYNDRTADMGKALVNAFYSSALVPGNQITYHVYDEKSADTIQIIVTAMD
jgi:hypothetical protein